MIGVRSEDRPGEGEAETLDTLENGDVRDVGMVCRIRGPVCWPASGHRRDGVGFWSTGRDRPLGSQYYGQNQVLKSPPAMKRGPRE